MTLTLGTRAEMQQVTAIAHGLTPFTFTVTGVADRDHVHLVQVSGNNQAGKPGERLPKPLVGRLVDQLANLVEGVPVTGQVSFGEVVFVNPPASPGDLGGPAPAVTDQ